MSFVLKYSYRVNIFFFEKIVFRVHSSGTNKIPLIDNEPLPKCLSLSQKENDLLDDLFTLFSLFQDVKLNGNKLNRIPTEALRGPESLQNLDLQDNFIGEFLISFGWPRISDERALLHSKHHYAVDWFQVEISWIVQTSGSEIFKI